MKLAGVVILYNPDQALHQRIATYLNRLQKLFIIDNSEEPHDAFIKELSCDTEIVFLHDGINKGIAKRLNEAAQMAINEGYEWLLTMDQDSFFRECDFSKYIHCVSNYEGKENIAQFGVEHNPKNVSAEECKSKEVSTLITSGSIINLSLFNKIGGFDEKLFIDLVDTEYCFRAKTKGYSNLLFNSIHLQHNIGIASSHRSLKSLKKTSRSLHAPIRLYYMTRNYFYVRTIYKNKLKEDVAALQHNLLYHIKNNLLYNKNRWYVLKFLIKGINDYKSGKKGEIDM